MLYQFFKYSEHLACPIKQFPGLYIETRRNIKDIAECQLITNDQKMNMLLRIEE